MVWRLLLLTSFALRCGIAGAIANTFRHRRMVFLCLRYVDIIFSWRRQSVLAELPDRLNQLGPGFVKLGQTLAMRSDLIGTDLAHRLAILHDDVAPLKHKQMAKRLALISAEHNLRIMPHPIAAGSVAVVYRGHNDCGDDLAIKLLRPKIKMRLLADLQLIKLAYQFCQWLLPQSQIVQCDDLLEQCGRAIDKECDLRVEAYHMTRFAKHTQHLPHIVTPKVYWQYTHHDMLVMDYHNGEQITDQAKLIASDIDPANIINQLTALYFKHIFIDGWFHGDPHAGNIMLNPEGQMVFLDFGLIGQLAPGDRQFLLAVLIAIQYRNTALLIHLHQQAGFIPSHTDISALSAAIEQAFVTNSSNGTGDNMGDNTGDDVFAQIKTIFNIARQFNIQIAPSWPILHRTLLILDGLIHDLNSVISAAHHSVDPPPSSEPSLMHRFMECLMQDMDRSLAPLMPVLMECDHASDHVLLKMWQDHCLDYAKEHGKTHGKTHGRAHNNAA